ncbi:hypothetical protein P168DRAFT_124790 [Aspergillus campestris IBT 28561]|uniref:Uncharacterized protein n=1 Tax=Aspergillus campestris (strain IBT 28561) TaxID=1392248 RepID=A0A2I1D6I3_ASPC2|nr:uncharacterized protein P168DRAFT_124790 [Aspergillus campestris IBT 28561]PKY05477.1 hypothetical protein P168DRAFT_124790 [Aspergillus campestris IBT 28561]
MLHAMCRATLLRHSTLSRVIPLPVSASTACSSGQSHISASSIRASSDSNHDEHPPKQEHPTTDQASPDTAGPANSNSKSKSKSVTQADQELRERLEQMSGEGGAAGIEYEDGKPASMKRSVRNNMFRYI